MLTKNISTTFVPGIATQPAQAASVTCPPPAPQPPPVKLSGWSYIYTLQNVVSGQEVAYFYYVGNPSNIDGGNVTPTFEPPYNAYPWQIVNVEPEYNP